LRGVLFKARVPYACANCGKTTKKPPQEKPKWFAELWPETNRVLEYGLDAQHIDKDLTNCTLDNGKWLCRSCHLLEDRSTAVGESTEANPHGYADL